MFATPEHFFVTPFIKISRRDPYGGYAQLRKVAPVYRMANGTFIVTGHAAATAALKEVRLERRPDIAKTRFTENDDAAVSAFARVTSTSMIYSNPPEHGRRRGFMARAFQPRFIERLRDSTREVAVRLFETAAKRKKTFDVIKELAEPLPVHVIAHLVGVPEEGWAQCVTWSSHLAPLTDLDLPPERFERAIAAGTEFGWYLAGLFEERRRAPKDDILTQLIQARDRGEELTDQELVSNVITLFIGGHETTTNTLGHACVLFDRFPEARAALMEDPTKLPGAVEELLRYEPAIHIVSQRASEDLVLEGVTIPKDAAVWTSIGAANRDPARFPDPDHFDITRSPNPHLAFGSGAHICIGAALARMELQVVLGTLFERYPDWRLVEKEFELRETITFRGYQRLGFQLRG